MRPLELEDIARYEKEMLDYMRTRHADVLEAIRSSGKLEDETKTQALRRARRVRERVRAHQAGGSQAA